MLVFSPAEWIQFPSKTMHQTSAATNELPEKGEFIAATVLIRLPERRIEPGTPA